MYPLIDSLKFNIVIIELDRYSDVVGIIPRIKHINPPASALLGYEQKELINKPLDIIYASGNDAEIWQAALATLTEKSFAVELVTKANNRIKALISLSVLPGQQPKKTELVLLIQDIQQDLFTTNNAVKENLLQCKDVESALAESEERFRQMAEMTGEWLWEQDPHGYYIYSSTAVNQILGFSQDEVLGKHYTEFLTAQDKADQQNYAASHQPFYDLINHHRHKDGHEVITESTGLPIINAEGKVLKWRGVDRDITARKNFQDALIESEQRTRLIIESSLSAIVIMDSSGLITDWNHQAEKMFGWSRNEAIGKRLADLIIPQRYRNDHWQGLQTFLHSGIGPILNQLIEHTGLRRDGSEFPIELSVSPLKLGNAYIFSGFIHDITGRKRLEHRFRQAVESSPNSIIMVNESGKIVMVNAQTETSFGYSRTELIGQPIEILVPERFRSTHIGFRHAYLAAPVSRAMGVGRDLYGLRKDGTEFPVEIGLSPIDSEEEILVLTTIVDITIRKATEAKIRQAQVNLAIAQSEIKIAQQIQASLLPSALIKSAHFEVTGCCLPADKVGGDYFDYFFRDEDRLDIVIADVSGHSIGPALFMVEARSAIRTQANTPRTPSETLNVLNNFLFEDLNNSDYFITLFYLQYDIQNQQLSFANAGHPPPLLLSTYQRECRQLDADGLILGVRKDVVFEEKTMLLAKGDLILIYTDGLTEAESPDGEFFGLQRVNDIFIRHAQKKPQKIIEALLKQLKQFCQTESFKDDITLIIFKRG